MDRVHRIGQTRNVRAIRFIMKDSIEERFINVQDAKHSLGKGSLQKLKKDDRSKARVSDRFIIALCDISSHTIHNSCMCSVRYIHGSVRSH